MSNAVLRALAFTRDQEQEREHATVAKAVAARLGISPAKGDKSCWPQFTAWCRAKGIDTFPTRPHVLACFILENTALGIGELMRVVDAISTVHENTSDPTLSPLVTAALDRVSGPIEAPRSWDAEHREMWAALPRKLKIYINQREADRDRAVRIAQNNRKKEIKNASTQSTAATGNRDASRAD